MNVEGFTGSDESTELRVGQSGDDRHVAGFDFARLGDQNGTGLKRGLALQHTGEHRKIWVMSCEDIELGVEKLPGVNLVLADFDDFVDPEERITVRDELLDFVAVHELAREDGFREGKAPAEPSQLLWTQGRCGSAGASPSLPVFSTGQTMAAEGVRSLSTLLATMTP